MKTKISCALAFLAGAGLVFIGTRFMLSPEIAEAGYGIHFNEQGDFSFHYIKGIRDVFSGLLLCLLVLTGEKRALAIALLAGAIVPITDMLLVLSKSYNGAQQAMPHIIAIVICLVTGMILLLSKTPGKNTNKPQGFVKLINPGSQDIEFNILPDEETPWHYHTLFSETFEVLKGRLELGKNKEIFQLKENDMVTIRPHERHYYHNVSGEECLVKVTVSPANINFQHSLFIFKGLAKDGLSNASGIPKKLSDLALFIYLNNSVMPGLQKLAAPLFNYLAKTAIKKGRLDELIKKYCS